MGLFLAVLLFAWIVVRVVNDAKTDRELASKGIVSPRLQAKYGNGPDAKARLAKYGFWDYLTDAWRDYWPRRTEALIAARDAKSANPGQKVSLRDRLAAAKGAVTRAADAVKRTVVDPRPPGSSKPATPVDVAPHAPLVVDTGEVPVGTVRYAPDGSREQWDGREWKPAEPTTPPTANGSQPAAVVGDGPITTTPPTNDASQPERPADSQGVPVTAPTVAAPTGEVLNHETHVAELNAQIDAARIRLDSAIAAEQQVNELKSGIDGMQQAYQSGAEAAQTKLDHQDALHMDAETMGHAGTAVDALPPNAVDEMFSNLELVEQQIVERRENEATALAALEAELAHVQATYGDLNDGVARNLGGDSRYVDSAGGVATATTNTPPAPAQPQPVGASQS